MTNTPNNAVVILAAGLSTRMRGQNKLSKLWHDRPLLLHCLDKITKTDFEQITIVLGPHSENLEKLISPYNVNIAYTPTGPQSMGLSLKTGIQSLKKYIDGAYICLGDMPQIPKQAFQQHNMQMPNKSRNEYILVPRIQGKQGHPVYFGNKWFSMLMNISGDKGARDIIKTNTEWVIYTDIQDKGIITDFDTPEDFEAS